MDRRLPGATWELLWKYYSALPGAELSTSYGTPSFKVKGKFVARLWEDGETLVLRIDFDTVDMLLKSNPVVYFITDHYKGYPAVLAHLPLADYDELCELLEQSWRMQAPKRLVAEWEAKNRAR
jgi:hypothetical protein